MKGGCACGTVRYHLASAPRDTGWCHCRICQRISGSPALAFTSVPRADFVVDAGADDIRQVALTDFGRRLFARCCGTPLAMTVAHEPDTIDVTVASLDAPDGVVPDHHIFYADRIAWAVPDDRLPRYPGERGGA